MFPRRTRPVVPAVSVILLLGLLTALTGPRWWGTARARPADVPREAPVWRYGDVPDVPAPRRSATRPDTVWFGGDDGNGIAFEGGVWDWDSIAADSLQGWYAIDEVANPGIYFARVTAADFAAHGDPCTPMIAGTGGMLWCGIHEDEAIRRDFPTGMGYQNRMCQWAVSPEYAIDPSTDQIAMSFSYFNYTEPDWDYTRLYVRCFGAGGALLDEREVEHFTGVIGSAETPGTYDDVLAQAGVLDPGTATVRIAIEVWADYAWSDEDGLWDSPCGPFAADDITISVGTNMNSYDFEEGSGGWTFERCQFAGSHMAVIPEVVWSQWIDEQIACPCNLAGNVLGFIDPESPYWPPGLTPGQKEAGVSGPVPRSGYTGTDWGAAVAEYDAYLWLDPESGGYYRAGYMMYPYTSAVNPAPHWSPRRGPSIWRFAQSPLCARQRYDLTASEDPLPAEWDSVRFVFEVYCTCDAFYVPTVVCDEEGRTEGSPLLDNARVGLTANPSIYGPSFSFIDGGCFHDGFGQLYPTYLEPSDRGDANIGYDLSLYYTQKNDWLGDSTVVCGPVVQTEAGRWLAQLCFRVARLGARQAMIPAYQAWKARLGSDPERGFVYVLMDSLETNNHTQIWNSKFASYFHEDATGFDRSRPDFSPEQEILPDQVFTPGTRVEYYVRTYWFNSGAPPADYHAGAVHEFEILPGMESVPGEPYSLAWPSVLYIDADNCGSEKYVVPALDHLRAQLGVAYDKYDYDGGGSWSSAPMKRSYGGTAFNPGGYGNNGCTTEQLLGYRLILLSTGRASIGAMREEDFELFAEWLASTVCGFESLRRGMLFNGDRIADIMGDPALGIATEFSREVLGIEPLTGAGLSSGSYREYNNDEAYCVYVEPSAESAFAPGGPGLALYGNGCPQQFDYTVLGKRPGITGLLGNLRYYSYEQTGTQTYVEYAQIVRQHTVPGIANWRISVDGFSWHHLSERGCQGLPCAADSACIVTGIVNLLEPQLAWLSDGGAPFEPWRYPCIDTGVASPEPTAHLAGPVDHLYRPLPNPFHARATIRFSLARDGAAYLTVYDVAGRAVRELLAGPLTAGEHVLVWDGAGDDGRRAAKGLYWTQLRTAGGYRSSMRLVWLE